MQSHLNGLPVVHLDHVEIKAVDALSGSNESAAFRVEVEPDVDQHLRDGGGERENRVKKEKKGRDIVQARIKAFLKGPFSTTIQPSSILLPLRAVHWDGGTPSLRLPFHSLPGTWRH